jgi:hypothetical protein
MTQPYQYAMMFPQFAMSATNLPGGTMGDNSTDNSNYLAAMSNPMSSTGFAPGITQVAEGRPAEAPAYPSNISRGMDLLSAATLVNGMFSVAESSYDKKLVSSSPPPTVKDENSKVNIHHAILSQSSGMKKYVEDGICARGSSDYGTSDYNTMGENSESGTGDRDGDGVSVEVLGGDGALKPSTFIDGVKVELAQGEEVRKEIGIGNNNSYVDENAASANPTIR